MLAVNVQVAEKKSRPSWWVLLIAYRGQRMGFLISVLQQTHPRWPQTEAARENGEYFQDGPRASDVLDTGMRVRRNDTLLPEDVA